MNGEQPTVFQGELQRLINRHSLENGSNTPDFVLALYLRRCLEAFDEATKRRGNCRERDPIRPTRRGGEGGSR